MEYVAETEGLGLPEIYRFGVKLEAFNVNTGLLCILFKKK